jgi:hypothetical protein
MWCLSTTASAEPLELELAASLATQAVALGAFGVATGPAPAARLGASMGRGAGPWWTVDLVGWSRRDLHRAAALPLGVAWRPRLGRLVVDLGATRTCSPARTTA